MELGVFVTVLVLGGVVLGFWFWGVCVCVRAFHQKRFDENLFRGKVRDGKT